MSDCEEEYESELGTKEHWDSTYKDELKLLETDGVIGHVWFEEKHEIILDWLTALQGVSKTSKFLDIGCGNGATLVELANMGFSNLFGSDYSEDAIQIAQKYAEAHGVDQFIKLFVDDALNSKIEEKYDVVFDKGMLDALILSPTNAKEKQQTYFGTLKKLVGDDGVLVISSCNLTNEELIDRLTLFNFEEVTRIRYKVIQFGGRSGSSLSTMCFKHKISN